MGCTVAIYISFKFQFNILYGKSGDTDQTPHSVASDLGLHCLPMSHNRGARLIWVNHLREKIH